MARDFDPYWRIFAEEIPSDLGIKLDDKQVDSLTRALEGAHENYGLHSGRDVADANWRAAHDREVEQRGIDKVMRFVQERIDIINSGPSTMFNVMNHRQKMALAEIFQIRELCK